MILVEIPCVGPYTVNVNDSATTSTAPNDTLADHNRATSVPVDTYTSPTNPLINNLRGLLQKGGNGVASRPLLNVYARVEWSGAGEVSNIRLITAGAGSSSNWTGKSIDTDAGRLFIMDAEALGQVNNAIAGYNVTMQMSVGGAPGVHQICNVEEAWIVVELRNSEAPPCRLIGRGDSLGVGSGRAYPPSKMQQTSIRGVGAY